MGEKLIVFYNISKTYKVYDINLSLRIYHYSCQLLLTAVFCFPANLILTGQSTAIPPSVTDLVYSTSKRGYELKAETARKPSNLVPIYLNYIKRPFFGAADLLEKAFVKTRRDYVPQTKILFNIYV